MSHSVIRLTLSAPCAPFTINPSDWLPPAEALLAGPAQSPELDSWEVLGEHVCAPWEHLVTTHHTARAALLGAAAGRAFYHHELRCRLPYPAEMEPELWDDTPLLPVWADGVLVEPKYFSFFQDGPLPAYNPNHRIKWRAHELLHGASAFYWSPRLSRHGCYVGTRLNELVPVVHWYGLDEIGRASCPAHVGVTLLREHCPACEAAQRPFWSHEPPDDARRAAWLAAARNALDHFSTEYLASQREIETLRPHPTPRPGLDASSDAIGYMQSHWGRLTSWSFGAWIERFCIAGVDYDDTLDAYHTRIGRAFHSLIGGELALDLEQARAARSRRAVQDAAARVLVALEWLEGRAAERVERALEPAMEAASAYALDGQGDADAILTQLIAAFVPQARAFPVAVAAALPALGHAFGGLDPIAPALAQLVEGAQSAAPAWCAQVGAALSTRVEAFARWPGFQRPEPLGARLAAWLTHEGDAEGAALVGLETWLRAAPQRDEDAERFGGVPYDEAELAERPARVALHQTLRRATWPLAAVQAVFGEEVRSGRLAVRVSGGEAQVMEEEAETGELLDAVARGAWRALPPAELIELIAQGWVVWVA
jgi:hypothetical protein